VVARVQDLWRKAVVPVVLAVGGVLAALEVAVAVVSAGAVAGVVVLMMVASKAVTMVVITPMVVRPAAPQVRGIHKMFLLLDSFFHKSVYMCVYY
jgi:hypothetical protein